jgi:RNase P subunit RPR2
MSLVIEGPKTTQRVFKRVICWCCDAPMAVKTIEPAMMAPSFDEIVYGCPSCGDEVKQTVIRAD